VDDKQWFVIKPLCEKLPGKAYIPASLCELLFEDGLHLPTSIESNMKNRLMTMRDKILLRKCSLLKQLTTN
jgi:hypothetical protein